MSKALDLSALRQALDDTHASWNMQEDNPITALTEDERRVLLGFTPGPGDKSLEEAVADDEQAATVTVEAAIAESNIGAPAAFDLRNVNGKDFTTPVKNQGSCGSCVAFGTVAVMETTYQRALGNPNTGINLSEAHLFYCHGADDGRSCSTGWWPDRALGYAKDEGVATDDMFPYTGNQQACAVNSGWHNSKATVSGSTKMNSRAEMKEWLSTKGSLTGCFIVYQDFFSYSSGVYRHTTGQQAGGHCVEIIGYSDREAAWICKNSWGTGWGDNGYFKIGYGQCQIETWSGPYGANAVTMRDWVNDAAVNGLWSNSSANNAYVHLAGLGWRKPQPADTSTHHAMLLQLAGAKAANRKVNALVEGNTILELYVI